MGEDARTRVLVVSLGRRGGVTEYGWLMGRSLAGQTDVAVIYSAFAENAHKWDSLDCPKLMVKTFNGLAGMLASFMAISRFAAIRGFARSFAPDVIYYPGGHAWKLVLDMVLPSRATTILTVHDPELHEGEVSLAWRALDWLNRRRASGYVLLNHSQRDQFVARQELPVSRVAVIPLGVFDDYTADIGTVPDVLEVVPLKPADVGRYVLFVGRIRPYKGIDVLLGAYGRLGDAAGPLVIAGSGEFSAREQQLLKALEGGSVHVVNSWLSDADMASLVASARFVVLPYRTATQSGVVPLSSAFGVPALSSATAGLVEQVVDGVTGILFPPGDVAALGRVLEAAFGMDDVEYARMSAACKEYAYSNWSWDVLSAQLLGFADSLKR